MAKKLKNFLASLLKELWTWQFEIKIPAVF